MTNPENMPRLSDAAIEDGLRALLEAAQTAERLKAQTRAAKEIEAAWHDPHWLDAG